MLYYKKTAIISQLAILGAFVAFIIFWEARSINTHAAEIKTQAQVIAIDLWALEPKGALSYMELATRLNNYQQLTIYTSDGKIFAQVHGKKSGTIESLLINARLIPLKALLSDIKYNNTTIGKLEAIHRHDTVYLYLYLLLVVGLLLVVSKFSIHILRSKKDLENRVEERTEELRSTNQKLLSEKERYRQIYNAPNDAIFIHDASSGKILDVNKGMLEMFGYDYEGAMNVEVGNLSSGVAPYTQEDAGKKIQLTLQKGQQTFDWQAKKKDGSLFWVATALKLININKQNYIIAVVRDVNDRKLAEQALATEKEQLAVTLRSIGDGVITTDITGNVIMLNMVAEKLTGWTQAEALGRPLTKIFNIINEQSREVCDNPFNKVISSGQVVDLANHTLLIARDGTERSIADSGAPIRDKESQIIGVVLVFRDVTEQIKTEKELLKSQKLESIGVLAGGIAHDFNNILAAILGNINLALFDKGLSSNTKELLSEAEKASIRAKNLTQQLLTFSKGGAPVKETSSLADVIQESANFVIHGDKVSCQYQIPKDLWLVDIDKGQISQVIQNIVINASHSMPEGGLIEISCQNTPSISPRHALQKQEGKHVKISIKDSGTGISAKLIEKIFDPYFSTKEEGSGLGLAICQSIINNHHGFISVKSPTGKGTTFSIYLPASKETKLQSQTISEEHTASAPAKILLMDDDEMVQNVVKAMLSRIGHEVTLASDGKEAIELYKESINTTSLFDILIMDLTIPGGMGGQEAVQEILKLDSNAKVIVSSGYSNDPIMANFKDFGFCAAIVKPMQMQELSAVVNQTMMAS